MNQRRVLTQRRARSPAGIAGRYGKDRNYSCGNARCFGRRNGRFTKGHSAACGAKVDAAPVPELIEKNTHPAKVLRMFHLNVFGEGTANEPVFAELRKIWGGRVFPVLLAILASANLLLLWMGTRPTAKQPPASCVPGCGRRTDRQDHGGKRQLSA